MAAKKKPVETKDAAALGLTAAELAPKTRVKVMELPPARQAGGRMEGAPAHQAQELLPAGELAPKAGVKVMELPPAREAVRMIEGDPAQQAQELLRALHQDAKVI